MKLLLNEQISGEVARRLGERGHDVIAVSADPLLRGLPDPELFSAAQEQERAVITYNREDFLAIVRDWGGRGEEHHGLAIVNPRRIPNDNFSLLVDSVDGFLAAFEPWPSFVTWL